MSASADSPLTVVLLSPAPVPGKALPWLIGPWQPRQVASVHTHMLTCTMMRLAKLLPAEAGHRHVLAVAGLDEALKRLHVPSEAGSWQWIDQGQGPLGQRLSDIWRALPDSPMAFFQFDSVDPPASWLRALPSRLSATDLLIGPTSDGRGGAGGGSGSGRRGAAGSRDREVGFWLIAGRRWPRQWLAGIDWQEANVYHQGKRIARALGLSVEECPACPPIARPRDLAALRQRLAGSDDADLLRLEQALGRL